jgi:hypothetical protein
VGKLRWSGLLAFLFITTLVVITIPASIVADDGVDQTDSSPWPMFRGNVQRTGQSLYDTSENPGTLKWRLYVGDNRLSAPVIYPNGNLIVQGWRGVWSISKDGEILWTHEDPRSRFYPYGYPSPAITTDGTILVSRGDGLLAFDAQGSLKWRFNSSSFLKDPAIDSQGYAYLSSYSEGVYSLDDNGNLRWSYNSSTGVTSPPSIDENGNIYVGEGDKMISLAPNGSKRWSFKADEIIYSNAAISLEGMIVFRTEADTLYAIDDGGNLIWNLEFEGSISPAIPAIDTDGSIYIAAHIHREGVPGVLYKISNTGGIEWQF